MQIKSNHIEITRDFYLKNEKENEANNTKVDLKLKSLTQQKSIAEIFGPNEEEDGRAKKRKSNESQILS